MRSMHHTLFALLLSGIVFGQSSQSMAPQSVTIPSGTLHLAGFLWKPAGPGPFPAVLFNHGRSDDPQNQTKDLTITATARILGPVFARHGYVFLHPFRRGEGLSADQGPFIGDLLQREELTRGEDARKHLQFVLLTTDHLDDGMASLSYLKRLAEVDSHRVAVAGHSFGGQITLLEAARDPAVRAVVTFGAAAHSGVDRKRSARICWTPFPELGLQSSSFMQRTTIPSRPAGQWTPNWSGCPSHIC